MSYFYTFCNQFVYELFLLYRGVKGRAPSLYLQLETVVDPMTTVLTMDMLTVSLPLLFLESIEMEVFLDMARGVRQ